MAGTNNKTAYADSRANILKTPMFRFGIPAAVLVAVAAVWFLVHFLTDPDVMVGTAAAVPQESKSLPAFAAPAPDVLAVAVAAAELVPPVVVFDFVDKLFTEYRPRLSAYIKGENKLVGKIEFYLSDNQHRREVLTFDSLREFGWNIELKEYGVLISKAEKVYPVTPWPFDVAGHVPERVQQSGAITGLVEPTT